ncbi:MAG: DUF4143 domain-containing protein, partial [Pseudomonadota bacterium]|nr:DUF4143 domain-containing protein [Pseudomonadota bacterium]
VNVIDKLFGDEFTAFELNETVKKEDFARAVINGGYPEIYNLSARAKKNWFEFYIKARITKDIEGIENINLKLIAGLDKLLKILAGQVSSLVNYKNIADRIGIADKTVAKYIQILEALYIVKLVPAYANNQLKRVVKNPKIHFIDSGLASYLLNLDIDGALVRRSESYGNLVESFVYSELVKHQSWAETNINIYHYRDQRKKEVDFVLESSCGKIVALEVKSGANLKTEHFKGLLSLAKTMKDKEFKGIVLYGGDRILPFKIETYQFWAIPLKIFL